MGSPEAPAPLARGTDANISKSDEDTAVWSLRRLQSLWSRAARPAPPRYPPISSIPHTSAARLSEPDVSPNPFPSEPVLAKTVQQDAPSKPKTVLYLAYGSNMCAQTFLGMRGIRPLSQVNVSAPSLDLTFDLPGLPYREPCFANTAIRKLPPVKPPFDPPKFPPGIPDHPPQLERPATTQDGSDSGDEDKEEPAARSRFPGDPVWRKGLYGVVYEVTAEDYARIVATEGGGASYHDILVPCLVLPARVGVPEKPSPIPIPPKPFLAHTLYAPRLPDVPDDGHDDNKNKNTNDSGNDNDNDNDKDDKDDNDNPTPPARPTVPRWAARLLLPARRPRPDYAQPSARYLKLLRDGAREHDLPADYQAYLGALQPYTVTTRRQKLGQVLFIGFWMPVLLVVMSASRALADDKGRAPGWLVSATTVAFNLLWASYDYVAKGLFGDGERTVPDGTGVRNRRGSFASEWRGKREVGDEEKRHLLSRNR
ncbi:gamma-glutamylcyclotransferase [Madurella fahalii]|uniref:gamma-glutamylcyclotransferase n=1 Tax=Madurella fahalii TaxID=1157608 RepID=A0ABQ0FZ09_9PEZI